MKTRGSEIIVRALEEEGVKFTFGIPGTHNIELYDALERSEQITPVLVTDEQSASFMADGVSRTSDTVGVVNVVPGAGVTHCLSGVAEALMDTVPLVVLATGIRTDTGKSYQLHDIDQLAVLKPVCKAVFKPAAPADLYPMLRRAFAIAREGSPGPVAIEIPMNLLALTHDFPEPQTGAAAPQRPGPDPGLLREVAAILRTAHGVAVYAGNGARTAGLLLVELSERLQAPVTTTIQGKGVFPESHPLWLWNGFGASAPGFVRDIMDRCDCLLAIGCRFGEVATASYGLKPPENLIHVDINKDVFNRNCRARLCIAADAKEFIAKLLQEIAPAPDNASLKARIALGHQEVVERWRKERPAEGKVSPHAFFEAIGRHAAPDAVIATDSGNGTFLAMEHLRLDPEASFIAPVDFSCMGFAVPAAIGAKMANPGRDAIALPGDGALLMTGLELLTAATYKAAPAVFVLRDGELGQIAKFQRTAFNDAPCSILPDYSVEAFAAATGCRYLSLVSDDDCDRVVKEAIESQRRGETIVVEVPLDYSRMTYFTKGVMVTNFWRFSWPERLRMVSRVIRRKVLGRKTQ
ncbi:MAG: thiamine pyrophosphate-binding protein [Deltaproteobacteria bacterium]|nr:thiamine pyrophosphate-binding protein [Deltaproteobacteria bacterium]